jgi:hypothetical protein
MANRNLSLWRKAASIVGAINSEYSHNAVVDSMCDYDSLPEAPTKPVKIKRTRSLDFDVDLSSKSVKGIVDLLNEGITKVVEEFLEDAPEGVEIVGISIDSGNLDLDIDHLLEPTKGDFLHFDQQMQQHATKVQWFNKILAAYKDLDKVSKDVHNARILEQIEDLKKKLK